MTNLLLNEGPFCLSVSVFGLALLSTVPRRWLARIMVVLFVVIVCFAGAAYSQCPATMPAGTLCITQEAGNQARENALELAATKDKVATLNGVIADKDKTIAENKETARKNEADLRDRLHQTELDLARITGTLTGCEADRVYAHATIDTLLKKRNVKVGLINF